MNRKWSAWIAVIVVLGCVASAWSQNAASRPRKERPEKAPGVKGPAGDRLKAEGEKLQKLFKDMKLTDEQQKRIDQIIDTHRQALQNWMKEHADALAAARAKMEEARGTPEKMREAKAEMDKLMSGRKELHENLMKQLSEVLTREQMDLVRDHFQPRPIRDQLFERLDKLREKLNLSQDQKDRIADITRETREAVAKAEKPEAKRAAVQEGWKKIEAVLTAEQKAMLENLRKEARERIGKGLREGKRAGSRPAGAV